MEGGGKGRGMWREGGNEGMWREGGRIARVGRSMGGMVRVDRSAPWLGSWGGVGGGNSMGMLAWCGGGREAPACHPPWGPSRPALLSRHVLVTCCWSRAVAGPALAASARLSGDRDRTLSVYSLRAIVQAWGPVRAPSLGAPGLAPHPTDTTSHHTDTTSNRHQIQAEIQAEFQAEFQAEIAAEASITTHLIAQQHSVFPC